MEKSKSDKSMTIDSPLFLGVFPIIMNIACHKVCRHILPGYYQIKNSKLMFYKRLIPLQRH